MTELLYTRAFKSAKRDFGPVLGVSFFILLIFENEKWFFKTL